MQNGSWAEGEGPVPSGQGLSRGRPTVGWERGLRAEEQLVLGVISREQGGFQKRWDQQQLRGCGTSSTHTPDLASWKSLSSHLRQHPVARQCVQTCAYVLYLLCIMETSFWVLPSPLAPPPKLILPNN